MTSEAPQDVAALPQTEAPQTTAVLMTAAARDVHENWLEIDGFDADVFWCEKLAAIEQEAAAGLLDQNDRLRSALRTWQSVAERRLAVGTPPDWETLLPMTIGVLRGSGASDV